MKVRSTTPGTPVGARLTVIRWGALATLALFAVSACSGSSSTPIPSFSTTVTGSATAPATGGATASTPGDGGTATATATAPAIQTATASATATVTITVPPSSQIPTAAPITGGGGTAGPQDVLLFGLGAAAILAGAGSLAYRRWLNRGR
jgi:hypothetical protein